MCDNSSERFIESWEYVYMVIVRFGWVRVIERGVEIFGGDDVIWFCSCMFVDRFFFLKDCVVCGFKYVVKSRK